MPFSIGLKVTASTVREGMTVKLMRGGRVAATGTVLADAAWGGIPVQVPGKERRVVRIEHVLFPAALAPHRPMPNSAVGATWPPLPGNRRLPTLGELLEVHPNEPRHFTLLCDLATLNHHTA